MSSNDPADRARAGKDDFKRGPNTEPVDTAQKNVTQGYGSAGKASIMSGEPDKGSDVSAARPERKGDDPSTRR
ncbi:MAG: hypothetical protein EOP38_28895 [Rubrivivax sp.]|nr:MAG: hypothetical protein EOP38_28895 [Rubrivivax sp.]